MHSTRKSPGEEAKRALFSLRCYSCSKPHPIDDYGRSFYYCLACGGLLEVRLSPPEGRDPRRGGGGGLSGRSGVWNYYDLIPLWDEENVVSMREGGTPLVRCDNLAAELGLGALYVKFEGLNPTGSFKDRGMTVGVSKAKELGFKRVICASTGNTSASLAAYSAKANMECTVLVPKGKVALGKVAQALAYGARMVQVDGNFDDCLRVAGEYCARDREALLLNSLNPFRIEGQKTAAFEIAEELGALPGSVILPMGNGGNITSIWKGFKEIRGSFPPGALPKMVGVQAEGAAPIARAFLSGAKSITPIMEPSTAATAINIGSPVNWTRALDALYDSQGAAGYIDDGEILAAQRLLASKEGLFVEPASAAPIAFLVKISRNPDSRELFDGFKRSPVVCVATGNGLKDPDAILKNLEQGGEPTSVSPDDVDSLLQTVLLRER